MRVATASMSSIPCPHSSVTQITTGSFLLITASDWPSGKHNLQLTLGTAERLFSAPTFV